MPSDSCSATPSAPRNRSKVAIQTSPQHGSRRPSDSCYATPSAPRNRSEVATQTSLQHGSCMPSDSCPPGLRKPSKEHFLIFHRYSTELFRGWTCLLAFCKLLTNMGLWKIVNVSAFGKPDASKMMKVSAFCKTWICHTIFLIYICVFLKQFCASYATRYSTYLHICG